MSPPKVQIVVLQYNNSAATVKCLESLKDLDYPNFNIIVIDNASEQAELKDLSGFVQSLHDSRFMIHNLDLNLGYSGGNNIGLRYALEHDADYALILNNDTTVERDFLAKLVEAGESDPKIGILGPAINEGNRMVYGGEISWLKPELEHIPKPLLATQAQLQGRPVQGAPVVPHYIYLPGSCLFIKRRVIEKIGLLDERYFLYFEDADYCLRARRAGYGLAIAPEAIVYHEVSSSTRKLGAPALLYYHYRNALLFNARNSPLWARILLPFWSMFIIAKQLIKIALMPAKRQISRAILKGVMDFYRGRFGPMSGS